MAATHLIFAATLFSISAAFAQLEIEIEGSAGWASDLPTWRLQNRWTRRLLGARAVTGYHLFIHIFVFLLAHLPFALSLVPFSLAAELRILSFLILFWLVEDYLWFVLNPAFGWRRFRREEIWWHAPNWWWIMPRDYWLFGPLGLLLYALSWKL
jgi:hypothetical protein